MAAKKKANGTSKKTASSKKTSGRGRDPEKKNLIRQIMKEHPDYVTKDVVASFKKRGKKVTANHVYNVLKELREGGGGAASKRNGASASSVGTAKANFTQAVQALGVKRARTLLEILAKYESA